MRDTSLEDFLDDSADDESEPKASGDESEPDNGPSNETPNEMVEPELNGDEERIEPATATYAWTPQGAACADCGASVERRWLDEDRLVCEDCKRW